MKVLMIDFQASSKFIPGRFVTSQKVEKFHDAVRANDDFSFLVKVLVKSHYLLKE